ncbi:hypothetical protein PIB30_039851 [Stylosanthes scabra]|uniref:Retrotransposon gag domain-containing protein n=1 Tax=Stylosanthes scabra TaxID=79078 RepID=A0ABU6UGE1_9FABA|nr:hypothetical protein [Stylosanthes scabra]
MVKTTDAYACKLSMRTHLCRNSLLGVPPTSRCVCMASLLRTHLVQHWPSRFCCDPFIPFALSGHFRTELRLLYPETLKRTHQGIMRNGKQFKTHNEDVRKTFQPTPKFETYTQFIKDKSEIIKEILNSKLIKPPSKAGNYKDQKYVDRSKYCTFHKKHGHNTSDCVIANDLLEKLARQGHLNKYISGRMARKSTESSSHSKSKDKHIIDGTPEMEGELLYISGGFAGGGNTISARNRSFKSMMAVEGAEL